MAIVNGVNTDPGGFGPYIVPAGGGHNQYFDAYAWTLSLQSPAATTPTPSPPAPTPPIAIGIEPAAYEAILYGKIKPGFVGGKAWMGGRIVEGPFYGIDGSGDPTVSAIFYFAEALNPTGTRTITGQRLRGAEFSIDGSGYLTEPAFAGARIQYRTGTRTQLPFDVSIGRYGSGAIAYRQGIVASITDLPIRPWNGIIPMLSIEISDSSFGDPADGITFNDALGVLLRYSRLADDEFEVSVPGSRESIIIPNKTTLLEFLQNMRRLFVNWNISYTDKLRIIDPDDFTVDAEITRNNHTLGSMQFAKIDPLIAPRRMNYNYIDKDRDYEPNIVSAQVDIYPFPSSSSVDEQTIELPIVSTASQATADVNVALFETLAVRSQMGANLLPGLFGTEPGDAARFADHDDINFVGRVTETQHDFAKWQVSIKAGEVLNCGAEADDETVDGVTFNNLIDGTGDGNFLYIASPACTDNGLMCGSFFFRCAYHQGTIFAADSDGGTSFASYMQVSITPDRIDVGMISHDFASEIDSRASPAPAAGDVHHCIFSADTTQGANNVMTIVIDDVDVTTSLYDTNDVFTPVFNAAFFIIGADQLNLPTGAGRYTGDIWRLWLAPGQKLHESDGSISPATILKFKKADGTPEDLGTDGSTPTGVAPAFYFDGGSADFGTNKGTGGTFTQVGAFTTVAFP